MKRLLDVVVATLGLALLAPLFVLVALLIVTESGGPVFFRQERIGRNGRPFRIHKFRSMRSAGGLRVTVGNDSRITRVGAILRRYRLDELPQLLDVVRGTMSLVGPRPELPEYVALYPPEARDVVLSVRPGITGPAAIAFRGESLILAGAVDPDDCYRRVLLPAKIALDVQYVRTRSMWLDLVLIAKSIAAVSGSPDRVGTPNLCS